MIMPQIPFVVPVEQQYLRGSTAMSLQELRTIAEKDFGGLE